jgi:hypothetical protein
MDGEEVMAYRIANAYSDPTPKAKASKSKGYLAWLHELSCCVTGAVEVQAAHVSFASPKYGHYGRGKASKVSDRWALPLSALEHARQHSMNEREYWASVGIDPHVLALTLHGLWTDLGDGAQPFAQAIINQHLAAANRLRERIEA